jgi:hypothetical protein
MASSVCPQTPVPPAHRRPVRSRHLARSPRLAIPALLVAGLALAGCGNDAAAPETTTTTPAATETSPTGTATQVDLAAVLQNPTQYDNQRITTTGVADQLAPFVLQLFPPGAATGQTSPTVPPTPPVTSPRTATPGTPTPGSTSPSTSPRQREGLVVMYGRIAAPEDGATVTVTGTVQDSFDVAAVEQTLGTTIDPQVIQSLGLGEDDAVLVADTVETVTGTATTMTGTATTMTGTATTMTGTATTRTTPTTTP